MSEGMLQDGLHWKPTGKRRLEVERCEVCAGRGELLSERESDCATCAGKGYVKNPGEETVLCPTCEGFRKDWIDVEEKCATCDGTGEVAAIFQTFVADASCEGCNGSGEQDSGETGIEACAACRGKGYGDERSYHSLRRWDLDRERAANIEPVTRPEAHPAKFRTGTGEFFWTVRCPEWFGVGPERCANCEERRELIITAAACEECGGAGGEEVVEMSACETCGGSGKTQLVREFRV